ncbi:DUF6232 family protein [Actinoplanes sp. NPDC051633]|uniref:DUF6232 family protein n=1 Tax=Actinoplanes sp. NPDC051633 TaxID=3155670 RepID=UPI0034370E8B
MITYYKDRDVLITSDRVRIAGHEWALDDLAQVWHRRGRRLWGKVAGRGALALAMLVPVGLGAIGVLLALALRSSAGMTVALAGGGILVGLIALPLADVLLERVDRSYDRGSRNLEIWARVRGADVLLLATDNRQRFGQIYRALQRALEGGPIIR